MTKILLVEDDKSLREIYGVRLLAEGYDIVSAGDGEEALAMAIKERPALIVSDVMMPKISGFDMLDILRSTTETKDIKVIMMTALSSEDQRERGEKLGADRYLVKSQVGIEDVVRTVHEVLGDIPGMNHAAVQPQTSAPHPQQQPSAQPHQPAATTAGGTLPQPTAPFSSPVPRPTGLGDRVLQPLENPTGQNTDIAAMMEMELSDQQQPQVTRPDVASLSPQQPVAQQAQQPAATQPQATVPPMPSVPAQPQQQPMAQSQYQQPPQSVSPQPQTTMPPIPATPAQPQQPQAGTFPQSPVS